MTLHVLTIAISISKNFTPLNVFISVVTDSIWNGAFLIFIYKINRIVVSPLTHITTPTTYIHSLLYVLTYVIVVILPLI